MNKIDELRVQRIMQLGCVPCAWINIPYIAQECHHLLDGGRRMGDWFTLGLCRGHHQGDWTLEQRQVMQPKYLVAISDGRKAFCRVYPTERELWEWTQERLGLMWPTASKIVPRVA